ESVSSDSRLDIAVFRIFQEVLTNVARHSRATEVKVDLNETDSELLLEVLDNGVGLPPDALTRPDRFGIVGMQERALAAGGRLRFESSEGGGTKVILRIPKANKPS